MLKPLVLSGGIVAAVALAIADGEAHKPITSKYTYTEHVLPIFRARCGQCHVAGGVAPMSLLTHKDAYPWAESIRTELMSARMPPWHADEGFGAFRNASTLSARELDIILVWASGGTPAGATARESPPAGPQTVWALGPPDLLVQMPSFTLAADKTEDRAEFVLRIGPSGRVRWIKAIDLMAGTPAIVRNAIFYTRRRAAGSGAPPGPLSNHQAAAQIAPGSIVALWSPGERPVSVGRAAFRLAAGAELVVRIGYRKTWEYEGTAMTDRSTIGVYFATGAADEVRTMTLASVFPPGRAADRRISLSRIMSEDIEVLAVRADSNRPDIQLQAEAMLPDGARAPLIRLAVRPDWPRRYWLERPLSLPRGSRVEVSARAGDRLVPGAAPVPAGTGTPEASTSSVRFTIDFVPRGKARTAR